VSDAYRGEEDAARERLASLREELAKREAHLAELVGDPEQNHVIVKVFAHAVPERARVFVPLALGLLFASFYAFLHGVVTFGAGALLLFVILVVVSSPPVVQFFRRLTASLPEHVDEFKDPEPIEPAKQMRVRPTPEEEEIQKREIKKRRAACIEIEQEIAENLELLSVAENKK
jgi:hypothetical protein